MQKRFVIDGEAAVLGVDSIANFNALHSRKHEAAFTQHNDEVQLYGF